MRFFDCNDRAPQWIGLGVLAFAMAACSRDREPAKTGGVSAPAVAAQQYDATSRDAARDDRRATVQISNEFRARCNLPQGEAAPSFEYDRATLRARGENVLDAVARCLKDGPLKDETITLIGRADPRGTEEYNDALGRSRAAAARNYLVERGVPAERIRLVSRGEAGARGSDEATWALDRRVDLELGDRTTLATAPTGTAAGSNAPILEGTRLQIETSEAKKEEHPNAMSYSDTAEGGKPVNGGSSSSASASGSGESSSSSGTVRGSASGSATVGAGSQR